MFYVFDLFVFVVYTVNIIYTLNELYKFSTTYIPNCKLVGSRLTCGNFDLDGELLLPSQALFHHHKAFCKGFMIYFSFAFISLDCLLYVFAKRIK